ncbi:hypothetical protein Acor_36690 [Acrocarpospora corrugata]|uniref:DUF1918 domain-containing protein n=1 Tax=Acrocarpospora corrugata TaxID=35763 RepID=A0A5M3VXT1_9ACTN|nr:DUF1918 domain-containing protein [Acrocarpospora corrugata]GES01605.1 hypothetical protein Acor_36690 [Acrocarpospora corrugata]
MHAEIGDELVVEGTYHGEPRRVGVIIAVRHQDGTPPYLVKWADSAHETLVFPGPDAHISRSRISG